MQIYLRIKATIVRDDKIYLLNGRKWFASGGMHPHCKICIFMGQILNPEIKQYSKHFKQSMIIVDFDSHGVKVVRPLDSFGLYDAPGYFFKLL